MKIEMTNGFYLVVDTRHGRVEVCRRGVILTFAPDVDSAAAAAATIATRRNIRVPTLKPAR